MYKLRVMDVLTKWVTADDEERELTPDETLMAHIFPDKVPPARQMTVTDEIFTATGKTIKECSQKAQDFFDETKIKPIGHWEFFWEKEEGRKGKHLSG